VPFIICVLLFVDTIEPYEKMVMISLLVFVLILYIVLLIVIYKTNIYTQVKNRPEQHEQVKAIRKREIRESYGGGNRPPHNIYTTAVASIVVFKFADGSVKEFAVGKTKGYESIRRPTGELIKENRNKVYDSIKRGDTGVLTYKERENIEEKIKEEGKRYKGRLFISFEKDIP